MTHAIQMFKKLKEEKKLMTLVLLMICGAALIMLSFLISPKDETDRAEDLTYAADSLETRLSHVMSQIDGAGQVDVLVMEDERGVCGVLIVADGAQELTVRTDLMRAAMTALDIPASSVEVFARKEEAMD